MSFARFTLADNYSKSSGLAELTHRETIRTAAMNGRTAQHLSILLDDLRQSTENVVWAIKRDNGVISMIYSPAVNPFVSQTRLADEVGAAIRKGKNEQFYLLLPEPIMKLIPPSRRDVLALEVSELLAKMREAMIREAFPGADELLEKRAFYETDSGGLSFIETKETFKSASKKNLI